MHLKTNRNKVMRCLLVVFMSVSFFQSKAQFSVPHTTYINTPYGNIPITSYSYHYIPTFYFRNSDFTPKKKYDFKVILQNDSVIQTHSAIHFSENKHFINVYSGRKVIRKIYVKDTKSITAEFEDYDFVGLPNDSCWLFRANDDSILTYSMMPEDDPMYFTFFSIRGIPHSVRPITSDYLLPFVKDDKDLLKLVNKDKLTKAIQLFNEKYGKK